MLPVDPFSPMYEKPVALVVSLLPFWIVRLPAVPLPTKISLLVPVAAPETPRTAGLGDVALIATAPVVGTPPVQLPAFVQSLLTAPVQVWAAAGSDATTEDVSISANNEADEGDTARTCLFRSAS
jgi:hypothetical protein